jgi:hypothetical protein
MATRQISKQAKANAKATVNTGATNRADRKRDPEPKRRTPRAGSRSVAAQTDLTGATAAPALEASSDNSAVVHERPADSPTLQTHVGARRFDDGQCARY